MKVFIFIFIYTMISIWIGFFCGYKAAPRIIMKRAGRQFFMHKLKNIDDRLSKLEKEADNDKDTN